MGCRFSDRVALQPDTFASQAKIVHIDIDRSEIDKNVLTDHHIVGSAKRVLELLNQRLPQYQHTEWKEHILPLREKQPVERGADRLTPGQILDAIQQAVPKGSIVATDVGQHQMWSIQHFHFDYPGQLLTSGGFGTMGFGLGAAIGAKLGAPDREVVLFAGDGGLQMTIQELGTIFQSKIPVKIVLLNNSFLGMVRQWQELFYDRRYSFTEMVNPDFGLIARGNGLSYRCVERREELDEAIAAMKASEGAFLLEVRVEGEENIFPMVPAGAPVSEIRFE